MDSSPHIQYLFDRYIAGTCTLKERAELMSLIRKDMEGATLSDYIGQQLERIDQGEIPLSAELDADRSRLVFERVRQELFPGTEISPSADIDPAAEIKSPAEIDLLPVLPVHRIHFLKTAWFRYVAVFLLIAGAAGYLYRVSSKENPIAQQKPMEKPVVVPGGNKATLTLSDGRKIDLDSALAGTIPSQGNTRIEKPISGQVVYQAGGISTDNRQYYNTITTPKGGKYQVTLPDHSIVWLDAASSITFPTTFTTERKVTITGEAYFEIAPDATKPFVATVDGVEARVLGTSFNINAYTDEGLIRTTLLTGTVEVVKGESKAMLRPGQQVIADNDHNLYVLTNVDTSQVVAWKHGFFNFNKIPLQQAMRQISQWYDVAIVYEEGVPAIIFGGEMGRDLSIEKVLKFLNKTGAHFRLEDRRIIVSP